MIIACFYSFNAGVGHPDPGLPRSSSFSILPGLWRTTPGLRQSVTHQVEWKTCWTVQCNWKFPRRKWKWHQWWGLQASRDQLWDREWFWEGTKKRQDNETDSEMAEEHGRHKTRAWACKDNGYQGSSQLLQERLRLLHRGKSQQSYSTVFFLTLS